MNRQQAKKSPFPDRNYLVKGYGKFMENTLSFDLRKIEDFSKFMDTLAEYRVHHIPSMSTYLDLKTCLEELVMNIFQHGGYEDTKKEPEVHVKLYQKKSEIVADITDNATPFNPLTCNHKADTTSPLEERPIGGLGIHLVKKLSDHLEYIPVKQGNRIILSKAML